MEIIPQINTVKLSDLTVVKVSTRDLIGYPVSIVDNKGCKHSGKVIEAEKEELFLEMEVDSNEVKTNVLLSILDRADTVHKGYLLVDS